MLYLAFFNHLPSIFVIIGFILIHFISKTISFKFISARSLISFAAGVSVAYVVINLIPYLGYAQNKLNQEFDWDSTNPFSQLIYVVVLIGFVHAYVIYKLSERPLRMLGKKNPVMVSSIYFWYDLIFFAIYNIMIAYLVSSQSLPDQTNVWVYFVAFGLHFLSMDLGMRHHHQQKYRKVGWVVLATSVAFGGGLALIWLPPAYVVTLIKASITGEMLLNVLKFELPIDNHGNVKGFLAGTVCAAVLFLLV
ncbi:hypothetical protein SAMN04488134_101231 [Amphibacillus marinus]|uniref:Uncharacterized protein n=1 Tax=Amphibacillus marinus TaxID=872970 RepID=A0A1H8H132_9BACI|nr:hypothetical protein [Amphibacillus marinus]SEN50091.1 hypothetical protein SAMN04488134_101231 [Amphibacillus marinus]